MLARLKYAIDDLPVGTVIEVHAWPETGTAFIDKIVFGPSLDYRLIFLSESDYETIKKPLGGEGQDASGGRGMGKEKQPDRTT